MADTNKPPKPDYDPSHQEELNYQPSGNFTPPRGPRLHIKAKRPLITRPVTPVSLTIDLVRLGAKTVIYTSPLWGPPVLDHYTGAISSRIFPAMAEKKFGGEMTTATPPAVGPIDVERCYDRIPDWRASFAKDGDVVTPQQPWYQYRLFPKVGPVIPPVFERPMQAGPVIVDAMGQKLSESKTPYVIYNKFDEIPLVAANALSFVEDRPILDPELGTNNNVAVNYPRFIRSVLEVGGKYIGLRTNAAGGSGFGVQTFKNEAYAGAKTRHGIEKIAQMEGASISLYSHGPDTREARLEAVTRYMNMVSFGRYRGFNDGMAFWFGNNTFNDVLKKDPKLTTPEAQLAFRQVMTLGMAVREPSRVLLNHDGFEASQKRMNETFIPRWVAEGIITPEAGSKIAAIKLDFNELRTHPIRPAKEQRDKAAEALRLALLNKLHITGADNEYIFNSCQVRAESSLYGDLNHKVEQMFSDANDPVKAKDLGLVGSKYLLHPQDTPYDMKYSVTIKQIMPDGQALTRISAHNFDGQFDPNRQGMVNTGSTNKPIFLTSIEQMGLVTLHKEYGHIISAELAAVKPTKDNLTQWTLDYLRDETDPDKSDKSLSGLLTAYGNKKYATSRTCWFTGEGMWCPDNFEHKDYGGLTVNQIIARSNNLGAARIASDLVDNVKWHQQKVDPQIFDPSDTSDEVQARRREYTTRFAQYEGGVFQSRAFIRIHKWPAFGTARAADAYFAATETPSPEGLAAAVTAACKPDEGSTEAKCLSDSKTLARIYEAHQPERPAVAAILRTLTQDAGTKPQELMRAFRTIRPDAPYEDARAFTATGTDFTQAYAAAAPQPGSAATHKLAKLLTSLPDSATNLHLGEELTTLFGIRHHGESQLSAAYFVASYCLPCAKNVAFGDLHEKLVLKKADDKQVMALADHLASGPDRSPQTLMTIYRALKPEAGFDEARGFVIRHVDFSPEYKAAGSEHKPERTQQLAQALLAAPHASGEPPVKDQLMALYGARHRGASRLQTAAFMEANIPGSSTGADFTALHRSYVAQPVSNSVAPEIAHMLAGKTNRNATPLAAMLFSVWPEANFDQMSDFLNEEAKTKGDLTDKKLRELYSLHAPRGYAQVDQLLAKAGDNSLETTHRLAQQISQTAKPDDPDAARAWFSPEEQLAALYGRRHPNAEYKDTKAFILAHCPTCTKWGDFRELHKLYADGKAHDSSELNYHYSLDDRQYLAKVHPMTLEVGRMIGHTPGITLAETLDLTAEQRVEIYRKWLIEPKKLTPGKIKAQIRAATVMADRDAWAEISKFWHTLGLKRDLKATLANIVSAPHSTDELTNFMSILLHGGQTVNSTSFTAVHVADNNGNPHEMHARPATPKTTQVIAPEVAEHVATAMRGGVETPEGTSRRLFGVFKRDDGTPYVVIGKTGTSRDGSTGDFSGAFWMGGIGGCYAVTLGAYKYNSGPLDRFTSAVAAQMVKNLEPVVEEMARRHPCVGAAAQEVPVKKTADASGQSPANAFNLPTAPLSELPPDTLMLLENRRLQTGTQSLQVKATTAGRLIQP